MLVTTDGIVLHIIKYGESSLIATLYTREFGRQSFIINSARSAKSKNKTGILQPLFLVNLVTYQKQSREVQRVKEIKSSHPYQNIPFDITKSAESIFIAEMLYKTLNEQESNTEMFEFIQNALLYFDLMEKGAVNFHLWFLTYLTEYLGFMPNITRIGFEGWFDLQKGAIVPFEPSHPHFMNKEATRYFVEFSSLKINELAGFKIPGRVREYILLKIVDFYQLHFDNLGEIKSLKILKEVFE